MYQLTASVNREIITVCPTLNTPSHDDIHPPSARGRNSGADTARFSSQGRGAGPDVAEVQLLAINFR